MSLANIISFVSIANVDPTTTPDHDDAPELTETVLGRNLPKPVRGKIPTITASEPTTGEQAAPIHHGPKPVIVRPTFDKLDARGFLLACRKTKTRDEGIAAIVAYTGLDWNTVASNFGTQDQEARAKAQRELRGGVAPGPTREEKRSAERSMSGFIAGLPVPQQRLVLDLRARAISAAESRDKATTPKERADFQDLLDKTNAALKELGF